MYQHTISTKSNGYTIKIYINVVEYNIYTIYTTIIMINCRTVLY